MLSDCVINGLYMRFLKLIWKNLISVNFPQFSDVSMWRVRTVSIGVLTVLFLSPDGNGAQSSGQDLLASRRARQPPGGRLVKPSGRAQPVRMFPMQRASG
jgi:hypothetical protein